MPALIDLTGKRFGRLVVLKRDKKTQREKRDKEAYWECQCDCGNIVSKRGHDLRDGKIISCGCKKTEFMSQLNAIDLTGQRFGKLLVIQQAKERIDNHIAWECKCDCGNSIITSGRYLRSGTTTSCGCIKSQGETKIIFLLQELNISFETQKSFIDCKNVFPLKFDFYLPDYNLLIEYNGKQHYEPIEYLGGEERFEQQQINDNIKKSWCKKNNIKLIEIPYWDYENLTINYIKNIIQE